MDYRMLSRTMLFRGISEGEIEAMLGCLGAREATYGKGELIYRMGERARAMGLVLSGSVRVENVDAWGNVSVLSHAGAGRMFAEAYACTPEEPLMVNVVAAEHCTVLMLETERLARSCPSTCAHHSRILLNLMGILARKNLELSRRAFHTAPKTIRGKVLSYLSEQAAEQGCPTFQIPFNRQQLADYLGADRSALSAELGRMQKDGLISVYRNRFTLHG